ncbi:MAG: hypothetical protein Kow0059_14630 [Candidatus Sumerlaeia bacterium]
MTITIREMRPDDLPGATACLKSSLIFDPVNEAIVREKTLEAADRAECRNLVAEREGAVAGFAQAVRGAGRDGTPIGWIRLFGVAAAHQNRGVGRTMLACIEDWLWTGGVRRISVFDCPSSYLSPGLDFRYTAAYCFFTRNGYSKTHDNLNLICEVSEGREHLEAEIERLTGAGFSVRRMVPADRPRVVRFLESENWPQWIHEIDAACQNDPVTVWLCWRGDEVVGFCAAEGNNKGTGWFGPMGVSGGCRGHRIGNVLCSLSLADIAALGHRRAVIPWVGPVHFYWRVCGARNDRSFWVYQKTR